MVNYTHEVAGLQVVLVNLADQIDAALDRGDRRAFRAWSGKWGSTVRRLETALLQLATNHD